MVLFSDSVDKSLKLEAACQSITVRRNTVD